MDVKQQVQQFYNQVGWQEVSQGVYQNAAYEDLRPVSREYIHRCHLRVMRFLNPQGKYLLDAGSGPIQYPEYLEYSRGYHHRVCADISIVALGEARKRIGEHGLYVVADIANLPFRPGSFEAAVSLHTIHHLPVEEHVQAYQELYRVLRPGCSAVAVNGWSNPPLMRPFNFLMRILRRQPVRQPIPSRPEGAGEPGSRQPGTGTFVSKYSAAWLRNEVGSRVPLEIWTWRSVSVPFLRVFIHPWLAGRWLLRVLYWLEERFPHFLGENGQYPLVVIRRER